MLKSVLRDYQRTGVRALRDQDGVALLADEVGLGKSFQSAYYAWRYLPKDPPGPIVVMCPSHLKENWRRELLKHLEVRPIVLEHEHVPPDYPPPHDRNAVLVINYDILTPSYWEPDTPPAADSWVVWLAARRPRLLIPDEIHLLANPFSARTRAVRWLARRVPRCVGLSGTPLPNEPGNLWAPLNILWPDEYPSYYDFGVQYAYPYRERGRWRFRGARNLAQLHERLRGRMIRRRKADVLDQLPAVRHEVVPLTCDLREYRRAEADVLAWLARRDAAAAERAGRAEALARLALLSQAAARAKVRDVVNWVRDFLAGTDGKLLVGVVNYAMSDALKAAFDETCVVVDGRVDDRRKNELFDRFNHDPRVRLAAGNILAAGTGWSCTSTSDVALAQLPDRPADVTQFAGRVHGIERGVPGTAACVRFLVAAGTIEEDKCARLQRKAAWAAEAVDGAPDVAELDIHDQLLAQLRTRARTGRTPGRI